MIGFVPSLYFELAWPYRRPPGPYTSPSGVITLAGAGHMAPCHGDREVFLCLLQGCREKSRARFTVRHIARWIGAQRRLYVTRTHIERVLACEILLPRGAGYERHRIGRLDWVDEQVFDVHFERFIVQECKRATPFALDQAAKLRSRPAVLDLYLCLTQKAQLLREFAEFTHEVEPRRILPMAASRGKARQDVLQRLEVVESMIDAHVVPAADGTGVLLDFDVPKRVFYAGSSPEERRERSRRAREIRQMPPEKRRATGQMLQILEDYERRLDAPDPWVDVREAIRRAEEHTARILERIDKLKEP